MTYTPEELQKAKQHRAKCSGCGATDAACITAIRGGAIKCCPDCEHMADLLDAVLPGYTQRIQAETLNDAADGIVPGEHSCFKPWCPECAVRADRQRQKDSLKRRAAALAAPVEPTPILDHMESVAKKVEGWPRSPFPTIIPDDDGHGRTHVGPCCDDPGAPPVEQP